MSKTIEPFFRKIYFRTDANTTIGVGHVMRCLALAHEARKSNVSSIFVGQIPPQLTTRIKSDGFEVVRTGGKFSIEDDAKRLLRVAGKASLVVIDHYTLGPEYQQYLYDNDHRLLVIDDYNHHFFYAADLLLNPNLPAEKYRYQTTAKLLLGPRYSMLRPEFLSYSRPAAEKRGVIRNILISMGGSDPQNMTLCVLNTLDRILKGKWHIKVIIGPVNPWTKTLERFSHQTSLNIDFHTNVANMAEMYAWADAAVAGSGSTIYELAYFRLPSAVFCLADNQRDIIAALKKKKMVYAFEETSSEKDLTLGLDHFLTDGEQAKRLADSIGSLVDGRGAKRVLDCLLKEAA